MPKQQTRLKEVKEVREVNFQLVQTIANQQMTEDRLNLQLARLKLMYDFVSSLNTAQTVNEIYQIALNGICLALGTSRASIMLADTNSKYQWQFQESIGLSENYKHSVTAFFGSSLNGVKSKPKTFPHCAILPSDRLLQNLCRHENIGAWTVFPLEYERRHLGDIVAYFDAPKQFTEEEVQLTQTIVTYIAIALTRKQTEQALRESQEFVQRIADTTPSILYIYDIEEQRNIYCNQAITHILGYTPSEIQDMGKSLFQTIVHPDDLVRVKAYHDRIRYPKAKNSKAKNPENPKAKDLEAEDFFAIEYRMMDINNKWRWFYSKETIFLSNIDGTVKQTIGTASDITQLKEVETKLQSSLAEKEILLREVHHRVKNNLSMVDSLLSMQARYVNDPDMLRSISDSQRRIHTMSLIHEQLYQSHDVDNLDFCEYLQRLVGNLYSSFSLNTNQIELKLEISPILAHIDIDDAISMGLIVNELLTNAFKYAFPDGRTGLIEVILYESITEHNLHLIVRDDGIGISQEIISNTTASLGLRIVHILAQQLRASLDISCSQGTSFHFTLSYPKD